jgi:hypothetical protein
MRTKNNPKSRTFGNIGKALRHIIPNTVATVTVIIGIFFLTLVTVLCDTNIPL